MVVVGPLLALLLLSTHALAAPIFFSTGNPGVDGAIAGAGLGLVAGQILVLQIVPSEANPKVRNHGEGPY